ncbi:MAG: hypothetical protein FWE50_04390 [Alphaproteobacteria bacterium]|nr:hypothetical protein [Alphaproteobacteria bacterium]
MRNKYYATLVLTGFMAFMAMTANAQTISSDGTNNTSQTFKVKKKKGKKAQQAVAPTPQNSTPQNTAPAVSKSDAIFQKFEAAKMKFDSLTSNCFTCAREVERDSVNGPAYMSVKQEIQALTKSITAIEKKYAKALQLLQAEVERNPYNTETERQSYASRREQLEQARQAEIDEVYESLTTLYVQLAIDQKTYWGLIVNRKVENSMK